MPPKRALDVAGAPRRELANEIETLCSDFEIRVGDYRRRNRLAQQRARDHAINESVV